MNVQRIYVKDAIAQLDYKDMRSFRKWCIKNDVGILSDNGSRRQYVVAEEFEKAKSRESVKYLVQKYGKDNLPEVLNSSMKFYTELMMATNEKKKETNQRYRPTGEHEKNFLSILTKTISE
jgi:uncharacterized Fe-S cluster-containing protein